MRLGGFDVRKRDIALGVMWIFMGFYSLFSGAWPFAIMSLAFLLSLVAQVIQDNTIRLQREVIFFLAAEIARLHGKDSIVITGGPNGVEEVK